MPPPIGTSKPKARKREPSFSTPAKKLRTISAPASCPTRPYAASSGSHAVPRVSRYRSGWRNGNRWSALLFSPPLSSSEESRTRALDKGKARSQEHLELVMESPLASSRGAPEANRWPDSAILKESMLASLAMVGKTPATTSSFSAVSEMRAVSAGNARMHGSLLSAASRVRLRDLARQARCGAVAPLVNAASTSVTSSSSVAPILNNDLVSGLLATSVSRATSTNDSSSCGHDFVPSSGPCDASASSSYGLSAVLDVEMASLCNEGNADVSDASSEFAATSALTRPVRDRCSLVVGDSAHMSTSHDTSLREPALLLPPLSDFDLHFMSKAMDERASLVIASQDDGKSEQTGRGEAIVRLKASGTRVLWPQCPPHSRRSTAPPTPFSSPMLPLGNARPSRSPTVFATQRYAHPNERPSNVAQGHTYPNASWKSEQHFSSPAFAHYRRATTGVVGKWVQGGFSPSSRSTWWRREQS
ncbi:hypothetical protein BD311DRAFT_361560 [Dichomitus squalens]|uniref:Uncharacterized protein n=1 Tax=Dichomitus squalens TaxID=114155 RepID=A0A4Q9MP58_9APHY|nr:hypothetical protein BD311DRAFT_361560 [Dichomitus squalens]